MIIRINNIYTVIVEVSVMKRIVSAFVIACLFAAGPARAQDEFRLTAESPIPIHAWMGVPPKYTNYNRFKEMADAGFTHSFTPYPDNDSMERALHIAKSAGLKLFVSTPELLSDPEGTVKRFKDHPALAGYHLRDEPNAKDFKDLGALVKRIRAVDDAHPCYINLFPNYATAEQLGTPDYRTYVRRFVNEVPVQMLSFDHYPVTIGGIRPEWYENLEIVSKAARDTDKPFWAFALTVAHGDYPIPPLSHLRLQVFTDLAYGAQGIQYFTYWTPSGTKWNFHDGPIKADGIRSPVYQRLMQVNHEIQDYACVFVGSRVLSVTFRGNPMPEGTTAFKSIPPIESVEVLGGSALVSHLERDGRHFLVVVNCSVAYSRNINVQIDGSKQVSRVTRGGDVIPIKNTSYTTHLGEGGIVVLTWE